MNDTTDTGSRLDFGPLLTEDEIPGETAWRDEIPTEREALAECELANRTCRPGHEVYARHANGDWTGPYTGRLLDAED